MANFSDLTEMQAFTESLEPRAYNATEAEAMLELSKGTDEDGGVHYRPWYVAAKRVQTNAAQLREARGAQFQDPLDVADRLLEQQDNYDKAKNLTVPDAYKAYRRGIINFYTNDTT